MLGCRIVGEVLVMMRKFEPIPDSDGHEFRDAVNRHFTEIYAQVEQQGERIEKLTRENLELRQQVTRELTARPIPSPKPVQR
jgi:hypothetical protein